MDPALSQGDTQFLRRPLGGAVVARRGLGSESTRRQGRPVQENLFIQLEGGSFSLVAPLCAPCVCALYLQKCVLHFGGDVALAENALEQKSPRKERGNSFPEMTSPLGASCVRSTLGMISPSAVRVSEARGGHPVPTPCPATKAVVPEANADRRDWRAAPDRGVCCLVVLNRGAASS